jgi:hypothetical protein
MKIRAAAVTFLGLASSSCLDLSDAPFTPKRAPVTSLPEAGPPPDGSADVDTMSSCDHCLFDEGAPCRPAYDVCAANDICDELVRCTSTLHCFSIQDLTSLIACAQPCLDKYGVASSNDPGPQKAAQLFYCSRDPAGCAGECK